MTRYTDSYLLILRNLLTNTYVLHMLHVYERVGVLSRRRRVEWDLNKKEARRN